MIGESRARAHCQSVTSVQQLECPHGSSLTMKAFVHIAVVFDNRRRSSALIQIAAAVVRGIMSEDELNSFSEETQERVRALVAISSSSALNR
jgi:hypothetical protein